MEPGLEQLSQRAPVGLGAGPRQLLLRLPDPCQKRLALFADDPERMLAPPLAGLLLEGRLDTTVPALQVSDQLLPQSQLRDGAPLLRELPVEPNFGRLADRPAPGQDPQGGRLEDKSFGKRRYQGNDQPVGFTKLNDYQSLPVDGTDPGDAPAGEDLGERLIKWRARGCRCVPRTLAGLKGDKARSRPQADPQRLFVLAVLQPQHPFALEVTLWELRPFGDHEPVQM